jgi:hypothetical protein
MPARFDPATCGAGKEKDGMMQLFATLMRVVMSH